MNEIITDLDARQLADRLTALELRSTSELARLERERDEAQDKYATEATEHMLAVNKLCGERDESRADCLEQARLLGMGSEREAKLISERNESRMQQISACNSTLRLDAINFKIKKELDDARNAIVGWENKWKCAIDMAARAELERDEALKCAKEYYVEFIRNASSDNKISKPNPLNPFYIAFAALFLVSCTYAPRSTNQTYTARQMAIGVTSQPNGMTSTTTAEQSPVIATYPETRVAEPVISASSNFLTIGSTKNDVVRIQGTPIEVTKYAYSGEETWRYGYSFITLKNGLVYEWKNRCNILKVKM